jgi:drug/metabolite transporter (DMT)-like permease
VVDPLISVSYRFILASVILLVYCWLSRLNLKYNFKEHLFMALQGFLLFGINYWLVYLAEVHLQSGLVAVIFSTIIFLNIFNGAIFLGSPIRLYVFSGAAIGIIGIGLVFKQEIFTFSLSSDNSIALVIAGLGAFSASLGNIVSAYNQKLKLPVIQTNVFGMMYGALFMLIISLIMGKPFDFEFSFAYISSLLYLALFGSIIAFTCYLTLLGKIGADKAAYVMLIIPVIALILSTIFEEYRWTNYAFIGVVLILIGNMLVLKKQKVGSKK